MNWVSRITTVGLMMVLPAVVGRWLDGRRGTNHWALIGLAVGLAAGLWQLLQIAGGDQRRRNASSSKTTSEKPNSASSTDSTDA